MQSRKSNGIITRTNDIKQRAHALIASIIPDYAIFPLTLAVVTNFLAYYMTQTFTWKFFHYSLVKSIDKAIPFVPAFVIPYILAYGQWIVGYIFISKESRKHCFWVVYGDIIEKLITGLIFVVMPTTMVRADLTGNGLLIGLVGFIYRRDRATNLFPSVHCLVSWLCLRGTLKVKRFSVKYKSLMALMTVLVFLSTTFIKQHVLVDMAGGIAVGEFGLLMAKTILNANTGKMNE